MYLVINKCVTAVILSNFSRHYLRNRSTSDIGGLGYIGVLKRKEHSPRDTLYTHTHINTHTHTYTHTHTHNDASAGGTTHRPILRWEGKATCSGQICGTTAILTWGRWEVNNEKWELCSSWQSGATNGNSLTTFRTTYRPHLQGSRINWILR